MAIGAPTKYDQKLHPLLAEAYGALGKTDAELATAIGITPETLYKWLKKYVGLSESLKRGKENPDQLVEGSLLKRALGFTHKVQKAFNAYGKGLVVEYEEYFPPDPAAIIFWLKNRRKDRWRDRHEFTPDGPDRPPINIKDDASNDLDPAKNDNLTIHKAE